MHLDVSMNPPGPNKLKLAAVTLVPQKITDPDSNSYCVILRHDIADRDENDQPPSLRDWWISN